MPSTISPNMSLVIPSVGTQAGPQYATDVNNSLSIIDSHDHTTGNGVQVPVAGLNIDNDLSFNMFGASEVQRVSLDLQASPLSGVTYPAALYASGVDLYYNDGSGNQIQITSSGQVNTATGNITGLIAPAAASYLSGPQKFLWQSNSTTDIPANMEGASVIVREQVAAGNGVTISAPTGLPASYTLTLSSTLPSTTNGLTLTNPSGNQSYLDKGAANTVLKMDSAGTNLEYDKLTQVNMGAVGQQAGTSSGTFTTAGTTFVAITGASATITTTGRPVMLMYQPSSTSANTGYVGGQQGSLSDPSANIRLKRDSTTIVNFAFLAGGSGIFASPGFSYLDVVGAGTYTYTLEAAGQDSNSIAHANNMVLVAYEL